jgi:hypothetical protein
MDFSQIRPTTDSSHRIYARSGMIPKYTGYLPRKLILNIRNFYFKHLF